MTTLRPAGVVVVVLFVLCVGAGPLLADEPKPGQEVRVQCKGDASQSYACYLPKAYDAQKAWPILYCFSPNARGDLFVQRFRAVCEERGWIVVGSMNSQNGPWDPIQAAITAMWADTEASFKLQAQKKLRAISEKYPDTPSGKAAAKRHDELPEPPR